MSTTIKDLAHNCFITLQIKAINTYIYDGSKVIVEIVTTHVRIVHHVAFTARSTYYISLTLCSNYSRHLL